VTQNFYRKYIDIINENSSEPAEVTDQTRHQFMTDMGHVREMIRQYWQYFHNENMYQTNPKKIKEGLARIANEVKNRLEKYDRVPGLWKNNPSHELRLINDASVNLVMNNIEGLMKAVDNKDIKTVLERMGALEDSLLNYTNSVNKSIGSKEVFKNFVTGWK